MGSIQLTKDDTVSNQLQNTLDSIPGLAETAIDDVTDIFMEYDLEYTPIGETHQLYDLTIIDVDGLLDRTIWSTADQWDWVIGGTRPHDIYGNWWLWWPTALHPVHHVKHPGTIANDYPALAYMDGMGDVETTLDDFLDKIIGD